MPQLSAHPLERTKIDRNYSQLNNNSINLLFNSNIMNEIIIGLIIATGGSLINFVSSKTYNMITGSSKNFIWKDKQEELKKIKYSVKFEELKKRVRIVVVDDEESFPIKLFQTEGYAIEKWDKVTDVSYGKLESGFYDIIILDIKGIAQDISLDDGLGVLESIKQKNPAQIIIAYSQYSYDLSKAHFWELADEKIAKPSDFLKMKKIVDELITTKYKPERYIDTLHHILESNKISKRQIQILDSNIGNIIKRNEKPDWDRILGFANDNTRLITQIITLGNSILKFFQ